MTERSRRPPIPEPTQRELWARAAGRCEFRGCNELLYIDDLTKQRSNLATISHIIGFSPAGPRGDPQRSKLLEKDIRNLMLTCKKHGKLMDDKSLEIVYPESLLIEFKTEHEQRIRVLTQVTEEAQTQVLLVNASIDERNFKIHEDAAFRAILPKYSATEHAASISFSDLVLPVTADGVFKVLSQGLKERIRTYLGAFPHGRPDRSLSIFALAPVPLLIQLGRDLGDLQEVHLYQRHRNKQSWEWGADLESDESAAQLYSAKECLQDDEDVPIAVVVSVSASVTPIPITRVLGDKVTWYEIVASDPGVDFLRSRRQLEVFGYEFRKMLERIRQHSGRSHPVHLFVAAPSPIAIEIGRCIRRYHPAFRVYEYQKENEAYVQALDLNF